MKIVLHEACYRCTDPDCGMHYDGVVEVTYDDYGEMCEVLPIDKSNLCPGCFEPGKRIEIGAASEDQYIDDRREPHGKLEL